MLHGCQDKTASTSERRSFGVHRVNFVTCARFVDVEQRGQQEL